MPGRIFSSRPTALMFFSSDLLGYVAFAQDMSGMGQSTGHPDQAAAWMKAVNGDMDGWLKRAMAGLDVLKKQPRVDTARLGAIGYCFGGATVQVLAYGGADIKGVVSLHGSLMPPTAEQAARTRARILICRGAADPMNQPEAMNVSSIDWQMIA